MPCGAPKVVRMRAVVVAVSVALLALGASSCAQDGDEPGSTATTVATESPPSEVTGVIVDIESQGGFGNVTSFVVKDGDSSYEIFIAEDVDYGFPLGHLNAHRTGAEPVRVVLEERDGQLYALAIEDA